MRRRRPRSRHFRRELAALVRHLHSASVFLFSNVLIGTALYGIGNFQQFLDSTQYLLLVLVQYLAIGAAVITVVYFVFGLFEMVVWRRFRVRYVVYAVLITGISSILAVAGGTLTTIAVY